MCAVMMAGLAPATASMSAAQAAEGSQRIHVEGDRAKQLVSLLVSGNEQIRSMVKDGHARRIVVHDLSILKEATQKYDSSDPYYALDVYTAKARIGTASDPVKMGEATGLFNLLREVGIQNDGAMEGTYATAHEIDCTIDVNAGESAARRFRCDVTGP
jgi:DUF971 family protein